MNKHTDAKSLLRDQWALNLTSAELSVLLVVYCSGRVGGDVSARASLYDKIIALHKEMRLGKQGNPIDGEGKER